MDRIACGASFATIRPAGRTRPPAVQHTAKPQFYHATVHVDGNGRKDADSLRASERRAARLAEAYQAAAEEGIPIESAPELAKDANLPQRWSLAILSMDLLGPRGKVSGRAVVRDGLPRICLLLASLAAVDKVPRNPGAFGEALIRAHSSSPKPCLSQHGGAPP
jgi:hypothetical protein